MKNKIWLYGGLLLIAAALCFTIYNFCEEKRAGDSSREILQQYQTLYSVTGSSETDIDRTGADGMPAVIVDGTLCIGILEIPALEITLPVWKEWSYANLKTAPCRYKGSASQNDLIIAGHNYRHHFGGLRSLKAGDKVFFTDAGGVTYGYQVALVERLEGGDVTGMETGEWNLTLFTCTTDSQRRVTVRCTGIEDENIQNGGL